MADPDLLTDKARENHARAVRALEIFSKILRDVLVKYISPGDLKSRAQARHKFYSKLTRYEKYDIEDATQKKTYNNFDITFLYTLVRNLCPIAAPKSGWGGRTLPLSYDTEIADDIERIRVIRNEVAGHRTKMSIEDSEFQMYWTELSNVCSRMEIRTNVNGNYMKSLETIRMCTMDSKFEQIKSISKMQILHFENSFYINMERITNQGLCQLKANNKLVISGFGGCGKSYISFHLAITLSKSMNNIPIYFTSTVEDFCCVAGKEELQILVVDDPFGKTNKRQELLDSWEGNFNRLETLSSMRKIFIILCCRTSILDTVISTTHTCELFHERNEMNLSGKFKMTRQEKELMFLMYASHYNITVGENKRQISKTIAQQISKTSPRLGFPQCCFLFFSRKNDSLESALDFFVRADVELQREIESSKLTSPDCFLMLAYMLHVENYIIDTNNLDMELVGRLRRILKFDDRPKHILRSFVETKLTEMHLLRRSSKQGCYTFQHETVLESVLLCYCKDFCSVFLEMAPLSTILEFMRPSAYKNKPGEICFQLSNADDVHLAEIYISKIISNKLPLKFLEILLDLEEKFLEMLLKEAQKNMIFERAFKSSRKARSIFVNDLIRYLVHDGREALAKDASIIVILLLLYPDLYIDSHCWTGIVKSNRCDVVEKMFEFQIFDHLEPDHQNIINQALISKESFTIIEYVTEKIPHIINEKSLILAVNEDAKQCLRTLLTGSLPNMQTFIEKSANQCNWMKIMKSDDKETVELILEHAPQLIDETALVLAVENSAKQCIRLLLNSNLSNLPNLRKTFCTDKQWYWIMHEDDIATIELIAKQVPWLISEHTITSSVDNHAKQCIRCLLTCDSVNIQVSDFKTISRLYYYWNKIMKNDEVEAVELIVKHVPWLISEHTIISAVENHAYQCIRLLFTSNLASIPDFKKRPPTNNIWAKWYKIMNDDEMETIELIVNRVPWRIEEHTTELALVNNIKQFIRLLLTCDSVSKYYLKKRSGCKLVNWNKVMNNDDLETIELIVNQVPWLIDEHTIELAVENHAKQCVRFLLTCDSASISDFKRRAFLINDSVNWNKIMKNDDLETVELIVNQVPRLIDEHTLVSAVDNHAIQCIRLLLTRVSPSIYYLKEEITRLTGI